MHFRTSLLVFAAVCFTALISEKSLATCQVINSDTTINNSSYNCLTWNSSDITVTSNGTIRGSDIGITDNGNSVGALNNSGAINGILYGIDNIGGNITSINNLTGGNITSSSTNDGNSAGVNNGGGGSIGTITNSSNITGYGIGISNGGSSSIGTISNTGNIMGGYDSIVNIGNITTLSNSGNMSGADIGISNYSNSANITTIDNLTGGEISASGAGINNSGSIDTINNSGLIVGQGDGITNYSNITAVNNLSGGTISGVNNGINNAGGSIGTIINAANITSYVYGIDNNSGNMGTISNSGTISGGSAGIINYSGSIITNINNLSGGTITSSGNFGIINDGTIDGISNSGLISNIYNQTGTISNIFNGDAVGYILNGGTINGNNSIENSGGNITTITNNGTISAETSDIWNNSSGTITTIINSGTINGGTQGIYNTSDSTIGAINNSGTISGSYSGIDNDSNAGGDISTINTIINSGTISSPGNGITNNSTDIIGTITNTGAITIGDAGIQNFGTLGTIYNAGSISGGDSGITNGGSINSITNTGTISGRGTGLGNSGNITLLANKGFINATFNAIYNNGTIETISNDGIISGGSYAIYSTGTIVNPISNTSSIIGNIYTNQDLTFTSNHGTLTGGIITANNLIFDSNAYQLLDENVNVGSGSGTVTNSGTVQVNAAHTITGNYTQGSSSALVIGVANPSSYGSLIISGNANMTNGHIIITPVSGMLSSGETFTIVQDAGTASYSGITATATGFTSSVYYINSGGYDDLIVALNAGNGIYAPAGQAVGGVGPATGRALDKIFTNGNTSFLPIFTALDNLSTQSQAVEGVAIKQLAPSQIAAQQIANNSFVRQNTQVVSQHQTALLNQTENDPIGQTAGSGYQSGVFWGQVEGGVANRYSTSGTDGYHQSFYGLTLGADAHLREDTTVGLALGWMQGNTGGFDSLSGSTITTNSLQLTGYGTQQFGPAFVNAMAGLGYNTYDQSRYISFLNESAGSTYDGLEYMALIEGGWNFPAPSATFTPLVGIQAIHADNSGYTESGAGIADLSVGRQTANSLTTLLGGQVTTKMSTNWGTLLPEAKVEWEHDLLQGPISTPALLGGVSFTTETPRETPNGALVVLAATLQRTGNLSIRAEYDGDIRSDYASHAGLIKVKWNF